MMERCSMRQSRYEVVEIKAEFPLTFTGHDMVQFVSRVHKEGLGDWCVLENASVSFPLQLMEIDTNISYSIGLHDIKRAICAAWIDFPYVLDTQAGYSFAVDRLTSEDIDEIIQIAVFNRIKYAWAWRD